MKFDLNTLNTKPQIIIDTKINFPKEDLEKAKILKMDEVSVKGQINNNKEESILNAFPKLRKIIEDGDIFPLNQEEVEKLNHLFNILQSQNQIVMKELFIRGLTENIRF